MFESPLAFEVLEVTLCFREPGLEAGGWTRDLEMRDVCFRKGVYKIKVSQNPSSLNQLVNNIV